MVEGPTDHRSPTCHPMTRIPRSRRKGEGVDTETGNVVQLPVPKEAVLADPEPAPGEKRDEPGYWLLRRYPKANCKRCFGRGHIGIDRKTGRYVPCRCGQPYKWISKEAYEAAKREHEERLKQGLAEAAREADRRASMDAKAREEGGPTGGDEGRPDGPGTDPRSEAGQPGTHDHVDHDAEEPDAGA